MVELPTGTVTFLFSDVQGSTALLERLGDAYAGELASHRAVVREAISAHGGEIVDQRGEEVFAAFSDAHAGVAAAIEIEQRHVHRLMRVRIGLHTGEAALTGEGYLGLDVHRAARICAAAYGGQVLLSERTHLLVADQPVKDLGAHLLKGISAPEHLFQVLDDQLSRDFVPLRVPPAVRTRSRRPSRRGERRTLEQLAWATRARLPATPPEERPAVSRLANSLVNAGRCQTTAARFCASVDRRALERRLTAYGAMSFTSTRASEAARTVERQLALLDAIEERRQSLDWAAQRSTPDSTEIDQATRALEAAVGEARPAIGTTGVRTRRTVRRGVRRIGDEYLVLTYDEVGIEQVSSFETMREARDFRDAVKVADKTHLQVTPGGFVTGASDDPYQTGGFGGGF